MIPVRSNRHYQFVNVLADVYRHMLAEEDLPDLLQGICDRLIEKNININAWVALVDKKADNIVTAEAGLGEYFAPIADQLKEGIIPECGAKVLGEKSGFAALNPDCTCNTYFQHNNGANGIPVSLSIYCDPSLYGFLIIQPPQGITIAEDELEELTKLSKSIGIALHRLFSAIDCKSREDQLQQLEERFDLALHASQAGLWDWNIKTGEMHTSPNKVKSIDPQESSAKSPIPWKDLIHPDDKAKVLSSLNDHLTGKLKTYRVEYRLKGDDGEWRWFIDKGKVVERDEHNVPLRMTGAHQDITLRKKDDAALSLVQQQLHERVIGERTFLQSVIDGASDPVITIDLDYNILLINAAAGKIMGVDPQEARKQKCYKVFHKNDLPCRDKRFPCPVQHIQESGRPVTLLHNPLHGNNINNTFELEVSPLKDKVDSLCGIIEVARDISDRLRIEEELRESKTRFYKLAHHDILTGLPNRLLFRDRLERAVAKSLRNESLIAIMFMDLDRFKHVNDTLGHDTGDRLLIEVSKRLTSQCRKSDTVARLSGDEFIFMLDDITNPRDVAGIAKKIMTAIVEPIQIEAHRLFISTSIGISIYPLDAEDMDQVIKCADQALYRAKGEGRNTFKFYQEDLYVEEESMPLLEVQVPDALQMEQFMLEYQPQFDLYSGKLIGLEALLRWNHPDHGVIMPGEFINVAEEAGMMQAIGKWVMQEVCDQIDTWRLEGLAPVPVTINVTLEQLLDPDFVSLVSGLIQNYNLTPELIEIEVTEASIGDDLEEVVSILRRISQFGVRLAIDNFGVSDIALDYLEYFPLDRIKIDQSLVRNIVNDKNMAKIVSVIILLAHNLGITVLAEGIEHQDQLDLLKELNCEQVQGFLLAKPQIVAEIEKLLSLAEELGSNL